MKTKFLTGLALAAVLSIGGPAFGYQSRGGGGGSHAVAAVHRSAVSSHAVATVSKGAVSHTVAAVHTGRTVGTRVASVSRKRGFFGGAFASKRSSGNRPSVAFGGNANNGTSYVKNGGGKGHYTYAFSSHQGWSHGREYFWNGHHYRWFGNGWFIVDPYPYYYYGYPTGGSVSAQVQADLAQDGYYNGPVDGIVGPGTQAAIAAYQHDNGLRVTGTITNGLLNSLGIA